jgi:hypothetical protein
MRNSPLEGTMPSTSRRTAALLVGLLIGVALSIYAMFGGHTSRSDRTGGVATTRALGADTDPEVRTDVEPATGESPWSDLHHPSAAPRPRPGDPPVGGSGGVGKGLGEVSSELAGELNAEQRAILREHRLAELGQLVAAAHKRSELAREDERARTQHAYQNLLSLWMKVHREAGPQRSIELLRREEEFYRALPAEKSRLFHLPMSDDERREKLDEFRSEFFASFGD